MEQEVITKQISSLSEKFDVEFEQALIDACMKKGFVLNISSAHEFRQVEFQDCKTLIHIPTMTPICKYSSKPEIKTCYHGNDFINNQITVTCEIKLIQL